MQYKFFTIPVLDNGTENEALNKFLSGHKVVKVDKAFVECGHNSFWSFCVAYVQVNGIATNATGNKKEKKDYKQLLSEKTFSVFSKLRECRKQLARKMAVPAYAILTDEEMANVAKLEVLDIKTLQTVEGIGDKKKELYGKPLLELYHNNNLNL